MNKPNCYRGFYDRCLVFVFILLAFSLQACSFLPRFSTDESADFRMQSGEASYYADKFHGRQTASGEIYDHYKLTAAHRTLAFGTRVKVTNLVNDLSVIVVINDRGPFKRGRIIDLSYAAARRIDMLRQGVVDVSIEVLD